MTISERIFKVLKEYGVYKANNWLSKEINSYVLDTGIRRNKFSKINNETLFFVSKI